MTKIPNIPENNSNKSGTQKMEPNSDPVGKNTASRDADTPKISPKMLELLVCPVTRGPLTWDRAANELVSRSAKLAYPIRNAIPVLLPDEARPLEED